MKIVDWLFLPIGYDPKVNKGYASIWLNEEWKLKYTLWSGGWYFQLKESFPQPGINQEKNFYFQFIYKNKTYSRISITTSWIRYYNSEGVKNEIGKFDTQGNFLIIEKEKIYIEEIPDDGLYTYFERTSGIRTCIFAEEEEITFPNLTKINFNQNFTFGGLEVDKKNKKIKIQDDWIFQATTIDANNIENSSITSSSISGVIDNSGLYGWKITGTDLDGENIATISQYRLYNNDMFFTNQTVVQEKDFELPSAGTKAIEFSFDTSLKNRFCYISVDAFWYSLNSIYIPWAGGDILSNGQASVSYNETSDFKKLVVTVERKSGSSLYNWSIRVCVI